MGKPFNDQGGSGTHLHISCNRERTTRSPIRDGEHGVSPALEAFTAGVIKHAAALMAFLNPTVNAYRRIQPDSLAPTHANWGYDNRATFIRIPPERGAATRLEIRVGDGAANPYLAIAAVLLAGEYGIRRELTPPPPVSGDAYRASPDVIGEELPGTLDEALAALERDDMLVAGLGEAIVDDVRGDEALRARTPPRVGLRLGDRRVSPPLVMIELHRIDHVCLRVADLDEASARWCAQFGLARQRAPRRRRAGSPAMTSPARSS